MGIRIRGCFLQSNCNNCLQDVEGECQRGSAVLGEVSFFCHTRFISKSRKTCRGLPILVAWFCIVYFLLLFGIDMQKIWIMGLYTGLSTLFGPVLLILHTFCYEESSVKLFAKTGLGFYKPCPHKMNKEEGPDNNAKVDLRNKHPVTPLYIFQTPIISLCLVDGSYNAN